MECAPLCATCCLLMQMCPPSSSTVDHTASEALPRPPSTLFLAVEPSTLYWQWSARGHAARLDTQYRSTRPGAYGLAGRMTIAMDANMLLCTHLTCPLHKTSVVRVFGFSRTSSYLPCRFTGNSPSPKNRVLDSPHYTIFERGIPTAALHAVGF